MAEYIVGVKSDRPGWIYYIIVYCDARGRFGRPQYLRTIGLDGIES